MKGSWKEQCLEWQETYQLFLALVGDKNDVQCSRRVLVNASNYLTINKQLILN